MEKGTTFVGLDVHKDSISVAMLLPRGERAVQWQLVNNVSAVRRLVKKVKGQAPEEVRFCYEAGACGYAVQRWIREAGEECVVVAPSMIPKKPGERIKTDRRDALKLSQLDRAGLLTEVQPPTPEDESARDLCRSREDAHEDVVRCRHRLSKLLLRRGISWAGGKRAWSQAYRVWLRSLRFEHEPDQVVLDSYLLAIEQAEERLRGLERRIEEMSQAPRYAEIVGALRCFRGIDTVTAMGFVTELHSFARFPSPRGLMAFLGLIPSEHSSGGKRRLGSITKAGNSHARRLVIEAAWHYRHRPSTRSLCKRREGQPAEVIALADKAMQRLYRRFHRMVARGVPTPKAVVAVGRELVGFIWAAMYVRAIQ